MYSRTLHVFTVMYCQQYLELCIFHCGSCSSHKNLQLGGKSCVACNTLKFNKKLYSYRHFGQARYCLICTKCYMFTFATAICMIFPLAIAFFTNYFDYGNVSISSSHWIYEYWNAIFNCLIFLVALCNIALNIKYFKSLCGANIYTTAAIYTMMQLMYSVNNVLNVVMLGSACGMSIAIPTFTYIIGKYYLNGYKTFYSSFEKFGIISCLHIDECWHPSVNSLYQYCDIDFENKTVTLFTRKKNDETTKYLKQLKICQFNVCKLTCCLCTKGCSTHQMVWWEFYY